MTLSIRVEHSVGPEPDESKKPKIELEIFPGPELSYGPNQFDSFSKKHFFLQKKMKNQVETGEFLTAFYHLQPPSTGTHHPDNNFTNLKIKFRY